jgi:prepilin-type N-terminal cleavage/methylation domain-containing protein
MGSAIKTKKGFTLVELVIVIVIVGILSVISVPIYRGYVEKAMMTEGKVLIGAIAKAELAYHVEHGYFLNTGWTSYSRELDIDTSANKYFYSFYAQSGYNGGYYGGEDANANFSSAINKNSIDYNDFVYISVYGYSRGKEWTLCATQYANGALWGNGPDGEIVDQNSLPPTPV